MSTWKCFFGKHDWNGCTCLVCGKVRRNGHVPAPYTYWSCDLCNDYHYMDCGDCEGYYETVTACARCGKLVDEDGESY
jgi:hypothetical protein